MTGGPGHQQQAGESVSSGNFHALGMLSSTGIPAPVSDFPSLHLQPQTWGPTGLPRMAAEKPGNCWKEALAWVYLLPWVPGQKEVESLRSRAPLGPECRAEVRGMNSGLPEALHWSQTRVSLTYPLTSPASWVGGGPFVFSISFFIFIHLAAPSLCCNLKSGSFQDPLRILDLLCTLSDL